MLDKYEYNYNDNFIRDYIKLHEIENVFVAENSLIIKKEDCFSVITLPKNKQTIIKILNNARI
ncbi:hypothetical protein ACWOFR_08430 [Carnobacterium gallinarum]|uniref:hypothetical protein n=1 Tax=Carnobacterium gallinarum TaxID=2749 RepID=UPI000550CE89|nr:hypothetical protein [Carnobacterium gallinarum]